MPSLTAQRVDTKKGSLIMNRKSLFSALLGMATALSIICNSTIPTAFATEKGNEVVSYAEKLVGISGRPNIITEYWNLETEWCAMTIVYVGDKTGVSNSFPRSTFVDKSGNYIGFRDWFEERSRFYYRDYFIPQPGDLIIFDYDGDNHGDHIGFVKGVDTANNLIYTIEGNANDTMAKKTYTLKNPNILGYCRPYYNDDNTADQAPAATTAATTNSAVSTSTTTTTTTAAVSTTTQTVPPPTSDNETATINRYYVSSIVGCNFRNKPSYDNDCIIEVLDTNTELIPIRNEGSFVYVNAANTEKYGYVHKSTISPVGSNIYTYGCLEDYYVSSNYGCNLYSSPDSSKSPVKILDCNQKLALLSQGVEYSYVEVALYDGTILNGYVLNSALSPLNSSNSNNGSVNNTSENTTPLYNPCGCPTYAQTSTASKYVKSDIGCKFRSAPSYDDTTVMYILDTYTPVTIISAEQDFYYCSATINQDTVYGYIHPSVIS